MDAGSVLGLDWFCGCLGCRYCGGIGLLPCHVRYNGRVDRYHVLEQVRANLQNPVVPGPARRLRTGFSEFGPVGQPGQ